MMNILPPQQKEDLRLEIVQKKVSLVLVFAFIFLIVLILILFGLKLYLIEKTNSVRTIILEREQELKNIQSQSFKTSVKDINYELSKIQEVWGNKILIAFLLEKIADLTPESIYFTHLSLKIDVREQPKKIGIKESQENKDYEEPQGKDVSKQQTKNDDKTIQKKKEYFAILNVIGRSPDRETLFAFKKTLTQKQIFKNIYFLPSSWIKPVDVDFALELEFVL